MGIESVVLCLFLVGASSAQYSGGAQGTGSSQCEPYTHACVVYYQCIDGVINTDGGGLIDVRVRPLSECDYEDVPGAPGVCCRIPGATAPPPLEYCPNGLACVPQSDCNTDGAGLIDTRGHVGNDVCILHYGGLGVCCIPAPLSCPPHHGCVPTGQCSVPGAGGAAYQNCYADELYTPGTCCPPPKLDACLPGHQCVYEGQCGVPYSGAGTGHQKCYADESYAPGTCCPPPPLDPCLPGHQCVHQGQCGVPYAGTGSGYQQCYADASYAPGTCCPPPPLDPCPHSHQCVPEGTCSRPGIGGGNYQKCYTDLVSYGHGSCCPPATIQCPYDSQCVAKDQCTYEIYHEDQSFHPHGSGGPWAQCEYGGQYGGVCCKQLPVASECGVSHHTDLGLRSGYSPVLEKVDAQFGEFPWQAIIFFSNYTFKCGASLIDEQWAITSAHCIAGYYPQDLKIRLGEYQVNTFDEPAAYVDVDVSELIVHPQFNPKNLHNSVGLIKFTRPVQYTYHINTVCLPQTGYAPPPNSKCFASGWGKDSFEGNFQAILKKVPVPFVEHSYCENLLRQTRLGKFFVLDPSFVCAGGEANKDVCKGDGGGPLVCQQPSGTYFLAGMTAWGIECGLQDVPGVYVNVQKFRDFISTHIPYL